MNLSHLVDHKKFCVKALPNKDVVELVCRSSCRKNTLFCMLKVGRTLVDGVVKKSSQIKIGGNKQSSEGVFNVLEGVRGTCFIIDIKQ